MAFNIQARIVLSGPTNLSQVANQIQQQIGGIKTRLQVDLTPASINSINQLKQSIDQLNSSLSNTQGTLNSVGNSAQRTTQQIGQISQPLNQVVNSARNAASSLIEVKRGTEEASDAMYAFGEQAGLAVRRFAAFSIAAGGLLAALSSIKTGIKEAVEFQGELVRVSQITNESVDSLRGLSTEVGNLATRYGVSSRELIQAAASIRQAGFSAQETSRILETLAQAANAPSFDTFSKNTEAAISIMRQFKVSAADLQRSFSSINAVSNQFAISARDLETGIIHAGAAFHETGGNLNEFISLMASVKSTTQESGESIAASLRQIFTRINTRQTQDALRDLGINLRLSAQEARNFGAREGDLVRPLEAIQRIQAALRNLPTNSQRYNDIIDSIGGTRQVARSLPLIQQSGTQQRALDVANAAGTSLSGTAEQGLQKLGTQVTQVFEKFQQFYRLVADSSGFQTLATILLGAASGFAELLKFLAPTIPLLITFSGIKIAQNTFPAALGFANRVGSPQIAAYAPRYASGGYASGGPSNLMPGEAVLSPTQAAGIGYGNLNKLNQGGSGFIVPGVGNSDTERYNLAPGSFVIRKSSVEKAGVGNIMRLAEGDSVKDVLSEIAVKRRQEVEAQEAAAAKGPGFFGGFRSLIGRVLGTSSGPSTVGSLLDAPPPTNLAGVSSFDQAQLFKQSYSRTIAEIQTVLNTLGVSGEFFSTNLQSSPELRQAGLSNPAFSSSVDKLQALILQASNFSKQAGFTPAFNQLTGKMGELQGLKLDLSKFSTAPSMDVQVLPDTFGKAGQKQNTIEHAMSLIGGGRSRKSVLDILQSEYGIAASTASKYYSQANKLVATKESDAEKERRRKLRALGIRKDVDFSLNPEDFPEEFANGGLSYQDRIPALLTPGEYVFNPQAVGRIGKANLDQLNKGGSLSHIKGYATGGYVEGDQPFAQGLPSANTAEILSTVRQYLANPSLRPRTGSTESGELGRQLTQLLAQSGLFSREEITATIAEVLGKSRRQAQRYAQGVVGPDVYPTIGSPVGFQSSSASGFGGVSGGGDSPFAFGGFDPTLKITRPDPNISSIIPNGQIIQDPRFFNRTPAIANGSRPAGPITPGVPDVFNYDIGFNGSYAIGGGTVASNSSSYNLGGLLNRNLPLASSAGTYNIGGSNNGGGGLPTIPLAGGAGSYNFVQPPNNNGSDLDHIFIRRRSELEQFYTKQVDAVRNNYSQEEKKAIINGRIVDLQLKYVQIEQNKLAIQAANKDITSAISGGLSDPNNAKKYAEAIREKQRAEYDNVILGRDINIQRDSTGIIGIGGRGNSRGGLAGFYDSILGRNTTPENQTARVQAIGFGTSLLSSIIGNTLSSNAGNAENALLNQRGSQYIAGRTIETAALYAGTGATLGSVIPGVGTGIGAAVGAGIGTGVGLLSGGLSANSDLNLAKLSLEIRRASDAFNTLATSVETAGRRLNSNEIESLSAQLSSRSTSALGAAAETNTTIGSRIAGYLAETPSSSTAANFALAARDNRGISSDAIRLIEAETYRRIGAEGIDSVRANPRQSVSVLSQQDRRLLAEQQGFPVIQTRTPLPGGGYRISATGGPEAFENSPVFNNIIAGVIRQAGLNQAAASPTAQLDVGLKRFITQLEHSAESFENLNKEMGNFTSIILGGGQLGRPASNINLLRNPLDTQDYRDAVSESTAGLGSAGDSLRTAGLLGGRIQSVAPEVIQEYFRNPAANPTDEAADLNVRLRNRLGVSENSQEDRILTNFSRSFLDRNGPNRQGIIANPALAESAVRETITSKITQPLIENAQIQERIVNAQITAQQQLLNLNLKQVEYAGKIADSQADLDKSLAQQRSIREFGSPNSALNFLSESQANAGFYSRLNATGAPLGLGSNTSLSSLAAIGQSARAALAGGNLTPEATSQFESKLIIINRLLEVYANSTQRQVYYQELLNQNSRERTSRIEGQRRAILGSDDDRAELSFGRSLSQYVISGNRENEQSSFNNLGLGGQQTLLRYLDQFGDTRFQGGRTGRDISNQLVGGQIGELGALNNEQDRLIGNLQELATQVQQANEIQSQLNRSASADVRNQLLEQNNRALATLAAALERFNQTNPSTYVPTPTPQEGVPAFTGPSGYAIGGLVYANKGFFRPQGTDTVPAMLTPGEMVVNASSTNANRDLLERINEAKGPLRYYPVGGIVPGGVSSTITPSTQLVFGPDGMTQIPIIGGTIGSMQLNVGSSPVYKATGGVLDNVPNIGSRIPLVPNRPQYGEEGYLELLNAEREQAALAARNDPAARNRNIREFFRQSGINNFNAPSYNSDDYERDNPSAIVNPYAGPDFEVAARRLSQSVSENTDEQARFNRLAQSQPFSPLGFVNDINRIGASGAASNFQLGATQNLLRQQLLNQSIATGAFGGPDFGGSLGQIQRQGQAGTFNSILQNNVNYLRRQPFTNPNQALLRNLRPRGFAVGGMVDGPGGGDVIPAYLSNGEFVMNSTATKNIGAGNLAKMNYYAGGGVVGNGSGVGSGGDELSSALLKFSTESSNLSNALLSFSQQNQELVEAMKAFPHTISLQGRHDVAVNINGADVLATLEPEFKDLVVNETKKAIQDLLKNKFPDIG